MSKKGSWVVDSNLDVPKGYISAEKAVAMLRRACGDDVTGWAKGVGVKRQDVYDAFRNGRIGRDVAEALGLRRVVQVYYEEM